MINVNILYEIGCPNYRRACQVLCQVISEYEVEANIVVREVRKSDSIFFGSPTLLIEGIDVEKCFESNKNVLKPIFNACRIFQCQDHLGCPSSEMIKCTLETLNIV